MSRHFLPTSAAAVGLFACVALLATTADAAKKKPDAPAPATAFDAKAANAALSSVDLTKCKVTNAPKGDGHVLVTFALTGEATTVNIDSGPWVKTPVAKCMVKQFMTAKVPAYKADTAVTVGKLFKFGE